MLGINSNINSLVAQQNLSGTQNALSQAITRLSSGKRINSAADDAAGLAISTGMQTQINGLNQGVSNANDGVSMVQTASSGLTQITASLQRIRQLAVQASNGGLTDDNRAALQQEVSQQISEVNRIASQTQYNGKNILDGSAGNVSFQVGANVGQTVNLDLSKGVSSASLGTGVVGKGSVLGSMSGLSLTADGQNYSGTGSAALTTVNVLADGKGGFSFTDQNNQALSSAAVTNLFGGSTAVTGTGTALTLNPQGALIGGASAAQTSSIASIQAANTQVTAGGFKSTGTVLQTIALTTNMKADLSGEDATGTIKSIQVLADGSGGYSFKALDASNADVTSTVTGGASGLAGLFSTSEGSGKTAGSIALSSAGNTAFTPASGTLDAAVGTGLTAAKTANTYTNPTFPSNTTKLGTISINLYKNATTTAGAANTTNETAPDYTSVNVYGDGSGGYTFKAVDKSGVEGTDTVDASLFSIGASTTGTAGKTLAGAGALTVNTNATSAAAGLANVATNNVPGNVSQVNISTSAGANSAIESIDNALSTVNTLQATLGAAQNRFTSISTTQQSQSTNLSTAQSQIQDANFAQETANLSKAQVLQQAGISVLAQANSLPQQVLKLLG
jgi:flagellin